MSASRTSIGLWVSMRTLALVERRERLPHRLLTRGVQPRLGVLDEVRPLLLGRVGQHREGQDPAAPRRQGLLAVLAPVHVLHDDPRLLCIVGMSGLDVGDEVQRLAHVGDPPRVGLAIPPRRAGAPRRPGSCPSIRTPPACSPPRSAIPAHALSGVSRGGREPPRCVALPRRGGIGEDRLVPGPAVGLHLAVRILHDHPAPLVRIAAESSAPIHPPGRACSAPRTPRSRSPASRPGCLDARARSCSGTGAGPRCSHPPRSGSGPYPPRGTAPRSAPTPGGGIRCLADPISAFSTPAFMMSPGKAMTSSKVEHPLPCGPISTCKDPKFHVDLAERSVALHLESCGCGVPSSSCPPVLPLPPPPGIALACDQLPAVAFQAPRASLLVGTDPRAVVRHHCPVLVLHQTVRVGSDTAISSMGPRSGSRLSARLFASVRWGPSRKGCVWVPRSYQGPPAG